MVKRLCLLVILLWTGPAYAVKCPDGQLVNSMNPQKCSPAPLDPLTFGAHCNVRSVVDLGITNGSSLITSATANFTNSDVLDDIIVIFPANGNSGQNQFSGCISSVDSATNAHIGAWSGAACNATNYGGTSRVNAAAAMGQDDLAGLNATVAAFHGGTSLVPTGQIRMPNATCIINNTWALTKVAGDIGGFGSEGSCTQPIPGNNASCILWDGPSGVPVVEFITTRNLYIHDIGIWGNSNAANLPTATLNLHENDLLGAASKNGGWNLALGDTCNSEPVWCDQGNTTGSGSPTSLTPVQTHGVLIDGDNQNNDKNYFDNLRVGEATNCFTITNVTSTEGDQSVENRVKGLRCFAAAVGFNAPFGGAATLQEPEFLDTDLEYNIGGPGLFHVIDTNDEMDTNLAGGFQGLVRFRNGGWLILDGGSFDNTSAMPSSYVAVDYPDHGPLNDWVKNTSYLNNAVIQPPLASNGGLFEFKQTSGGTCTSGGGSAPLWSSVQVIGNTITDNTCTWTTTYTGDNNTSSMLVMENGFHIVESGVLPPTQPVSFDMNPVNAGGVGKDALYANAVLASADMNSGQVVLSATNVNALYQGKYIFNSAYFGSTLGEDTKCTNNGGVITCSQFPPPGPPTIGSPQSGTSANCSGAGPSATITAGAGDTLYAIVAAAGTGTNPTYSQTAFSDNNGGSWVRVDRGTNGSMCPSDTSGSNSVLCMYKSVKHPAGSTVVSSTINGAGTGTCESKVVVVDVAGIGTPVYDQSHGNSGISAAIDSGATAALSKPVEFCIGAGGVFSSNTSPSAGPSGGFTSLSNVLGATETLWTGYKILTNGTGNTQDIGFTAGGSVTWAALVSCDEQIPQ